MQYAIQWKIFELRTGLHLLTHRHTQNMYSQHWSYVFSPCGFKVRPGWFCVIRKAFSFILWQVWNVTCTAAVHEHTLKSSLSLCVFASMCALRLLMMAPKRENPHHHQILLLMSVVPAKGFHSLPLSFCLLWFFLTINMLKSPVGHLLRSVHL